MASNPPDSDPSTSDDPPLPTDPVEREIELRRRAREREAENDIRRNRSADAWKMYALATQWFFAGLAGGFIGWLIDGAIGTEPWLMIALALVGIVAGLARLIREGFRSDGVARR